MLLLGGVRLWMCSVWLVVGFFVCTVFGLVVKLGCALWGVKDVFGLVVVARV